jgi:serine/threonine-protein kinase
MGQVYEAENELSRTRRALKVIRPDLLADQESRARFLREVDLAHRVQHPNLVESHDPFVAEAWVVLPMELLEGETLAVRLGRGRLGIDEALDLVTAVARGAGAIHEASLIHRDLKPGNVFLARGADGQVTPKILDLGAARDVFGERLTVTGVTVGSPAYMAPEQMSGERVLDARTDVYALGVILYACLTGRRPYENDQKGSAISKMIARAPVARPRSLRPEVSPELDALVMRAIAFDRADRFSDGHALADTIERLRGIEPSPRDDRTDTQDTSTSAQPTADEIDAWLKARTAPTAALAEEPETVSSEAAIAPEAPVVEEVTREMRRAPRPDVAAAADPAPTFRQPPSVVRPGLARSPSPAAENATAPASRLPWLVALGLTLLGGILGGLWWLASAAP